MLEALSVLGNFMLCCIINKISANKYFIFAFNSLTPLLNSARHVITTNASYTFFPGLMIQLANLCANNTFRTIINKPIMVMKIICLIVKKLDCTKTINV